MEKRQESAFPDVVVSKSIIYQDLSRSGMGVSHLRATLSETEACGTRGTCLPAALWHLFHAEGYVGHVNGLQVNTQIDGDMPTDMGFSVQEFFQFWNVVRCMMGRSRVGRHSVRDVLRRVDVRCGSLPGSGEKENN